MENTKDFVNESKMLIETLLKKDNRKFSYDNDVLISIIPIEEYQLLCRLNIRFKPDLIEWLVSIPMPKTGEEEKKRLEELAEEINKGYNDELQVLAFGLMEDGNILGRLAYREEITRENDIMIHTGMMYALVNENIRRFLPLFMMAVVSKIEGDVGDLVKKVSEEGRQKIISNLGGKGDNLNKDAEEKKDSSAPYMKIDTTEVNARTKDIRMTFDFEGFDAAHNREIDQMIGILRSNEPLFVDNKGFNSSRYLGRMVGAYSAAMSSKRTPRATWNGKEAVLSPFTEEEEKHWKMTAEMMKGNFSLDKVFTLGMWEGLYIFMFEKDFSLLHEEIDIDLNQRLSGTYVKSFMYARLARKAFSGIEKWDMPTEKVVTLLVEEDGIPNNEAEIITNNCLALYLKNLKKTATQYTLVGGGLLIAGAFFLVCCFIFQWKASLMALPILMLIMGYVTAKKSYDEWKQYRLKRHWLPAGDLGKTYKQI